MPRDWEYEDAWDAIFCPHCDTPQKRGHDAIGANHRNEATIECEQCGRPFDVKFSTEVWYFTRPSEEEGV